MLLDQLNIFGGAGVDNLNVYKEQLQTLSTGMRQVKRVVITAEQQIRLKNTFRLHNTELKERPLLILRDLETLSRLVNVIASTNFFRREIEDGTLQVDDEDIDKAIYLWENLIELRRQLYQQQKRNVLTISDLIISGLARRDEKATIKSLFEMFVVRKKKTSKSTFYREIRKLVEKGVVIQEGKRDGILSLVMS